MRSEIKSTEQEMKQRHFLYNFDKSMNLVVFTLYAFFLQDQIKTNKQSGQRIFDLNNPPLKSNFKTFLRKFQKKNKKDFVFDSAKKER